MKLFKNILKILLVLIVVLAGFGYYTYKTSDYYKYFAGEEYKSVDLSKPMDEQKVLVTLGSRTFNIPKVYVQTNLGGKQEQDGLNLVYVMPDLTHRLAFKDKAEYDKAFNEHRMAHMLIQPAEKITPPDKMVENRKKFNPSYQFVSKEHGLDRYSDADNAKHPMSVNDDTYLELDNEGKVLSFISCSSEKKTAEMKKGFPDAFSGCSHHFVDNNLNYDIYLNKANYLKDWQLYRQKAIAFINQFEVKSTNNTKEQ